MMSKDELSDAYLAYIGCLNRRDWAALRSFVHDDVHHNGWPLGFAGYREMLENDVRQIPDLRFEIDFLIADPPRIASRLVFDCTPARDFMGLPVDGRRVTFAENVFYEFDRGKIRSVWSIVDKSAVELQIST